MTMWVRLIGGPNNGEVKKVDGDQREINVSQIMPLQGRAAHRNFGLSSITTEVKFSRYTRRMVLTVAGEEIIYFASDALSDFEALQSVLGA